MRIVVVGSGIAGVTFAEKCLSLAATTSHSPALEISLVTNETEGYYSRPLLSRGFSNDKIEQIIVLKTFDKLRASGIHVSSGSEAIAIDTSQQTLTLEQNGQQQTLIYDRLVLAQGSEAFVPPPFRPYQDLFFGLNNLADLKALRALRQVLLNQQQTPHWAVIGGGLIGCEIASDLAVSGDQVTIYHAMDRLMERQLHPEDSQLLLEVLAQSGVTVLFNQKVQAFSKQGQKFLVTTEADNVFDGVVVACGFMPRTQLARQAGLQIGRGIQVDSYLQTNNPNIWALGDVAELPNGKVYAFIAPIRHQANWLASYILGLETSAWEVPQFTSKAKVHGFEAKHAYNL